MFDYVKCEYPLPDGWKPSSPFQTKDLDCELAEYTIDYGGHLLSPGGEPWAFTGVVSIYDSNISAYGAGYCLTDDKQKPWSREYKFTFVDGVVQNVTGGADENFYSDVTWLQDRGEFHRLTAEARQKAEAERYSKDHTRAMELAHLADLETDPDRKLRLYHDAAHLEAGLARRTHQEPSCSVLTRSAMSLYINAGSSYSALQELCCYIQMQKRCNDPPPPEIVREIAVLVRDIANNMEFKADHGQRFQ